MAKVEDGKTRMFYLYTTFFISIMNLTSIDILLPEIMIDMGVTLNWLAWVVNACSLLLAVFIPIAGRLGDIYGPHRFFFFGVLSLGLGSLICGSAISLAWLITGRAVQAIGTAMLMPNALAILLTNGAGRSRGRILGTWSSIGASGSLLGPVTSGLLANLLSWRGSFLVIAGLLGTFALVARAQILTAINPKQAEQERAQSFDLGGAALLVTAITSLLLGITLLPDWGWGNGWVRSSLVFCIVLLYLFYRVERRASDPLLDTNLFMQPRFLLGLTAGFLEQFVMAGIFFVLPIFFYTVQGCSAASTALMLAPVTAAVALASPLGGRFSDRHGPGPPITTGMLLRGFSFLLLSRVGMSTPYPYIAACLALNGAGFGIATVPALHAVITAVGSGRFGAASGMHNMVRFTGAAVGTTIGGILLYASIPASFSSLTGPIPGFHDIYLLGAASCLLGVLAGIMLWIGGKTAK